MWAGSLILIGMWNRSICGFARFPDWYVDPILRGSTRNIPDRYVALLSAKLHGLTHSIRERDAASPAAFVTVSWANL